MRVPPHTPPRRRYLFVDTWLISQTSLFLTQPAAIVSSPVSTINTSEHSQPQWSSSPNSKCHTVWGPLLRNVNLALRLDALLCRQTPASSSISWRDVSYFSGLSSAGAFLKQTWYFLFLGLLSTASFLKGQIPDTGSIPVSSQEPFSSVFLCSARNTLILMLLIHTSDVCFCTWYVDTYSRNE